MTRLSTTGETQIGGSHLQGAEQTIGPGSSHIAQSFSSPRAVAKDTNAWVGRPLDKYIIEKWLGGGGMGQVYLARHRWLDVPVAVKVMNSMHGCDPEAIDRFRREAKLAAMLDHPNIVKATDGGTVEDSLYLVTEYIEGVDLKHLVEKHGPLSPKHACWIVMEVAKGLHHAHQQGMVHRDIKPANVMLLTNGSVKILDLGLARIANSQTNMTATGQFMGTVDYVSPEQAADTRNIDHRADIYSLGCTLYYLLTGRAPFDGAAYDSIVSKILAHTEEAPPEIASLGLQVDKTITAIVDKMMAKHPDDRFHDAEQLAKALGPFAEPLDGNRRVNTSDSNRPATGFTDALENFADGVFKCIWVILRWFFSMIGVLVRVESNVTSRLGGKKQYRWELSPKGIAVAIALVAFFSYIIFGGFIIIEEVPY